MDNPVNHRSMRRIRSPGRVLGCVAALALNAALIAGATASVAATTPPRDAAALQADLQAILDDWVVRFEKPGATAAVKLPDGSEIAIASGWSDRELGRRMTPMSRMHAGSHPKTFTAALAFALQGEGKLSLDDPIVKFVGKEPWFRHVPYGAKITIRHLMRMEAGLEAVPEVYAPPLLEGFWNNYLPRYRYDTLLNTITRWHVSFEPGKGESYTDIQYIMLAIVLEHASGEVFEEAVERRFMHPLGLDLTAPADRRVDVLVAKGYTDGNTRNRGVAAWQDDAISTDGVLDINLSYSFTSGHYFSNSRDLARWTWTLYGGRALKADYLADMTRKGFPDAEPPSMGHLKEGAPDAPPEGDNVPQLKGPTPYYGAGAVLFDDAKWGAVRSHDGGMPGYSTTASYYVCLDTAVASQTNRRDTTETPALDLQRRLIDRVVDYLRATGRKIKPGAC